MCEDSMFLENNHSLYSNKGIYYKGLHKGYMGGVSCSRSTCCMHLCMQTHTDHHFSDFL